MHAKDLLLFVIFFIIWPFSARSGTAALPTSDDSLTTYWLNEIVVEGKKLDLLHSLPGQKVDSRAIQAITPTTATQALALAPGIYLSRSAKNETTFRLRGFEQRQVSVFLDGIPISVPFNGLVDLAQFAGDNVEEIRVSGDVSSVLYGINTLGGSVNILTGFGPSQGRLRLRSELGDYGRFYTSLKFQGRHNRLQYFASANFSRSPDFRLAHHPDPMPNENGGRRDHSSFQKTSGGFKLKYSLSPRHQIGLQANVISNRFDIPPNALMARPRYWKFTRWQRQLFSVNSEHRLGNRLLLRSIGFFDRYANTLKSYDDASYRTQTKRYAFTSIYDDYSVGCNIYPQLQWFSAGLTSGLLAFKQDVHRQRSPETSFATYATRLFTVGLQQNWNISSRWFAQLGADWNYLQPVKAAHAPLRTPISLLNAQMLLNTRMGSNWVLHFSTGQKSRFPTLKELYSEYLGHSIANPNLKPEHAFNNEIGLEWRTPQNGLHTALFYNVLKDLIAPQYLPGEKGRPLSQMQNIGKAILSGFEIGFRHSSPKSHLMANYLFLSARNISPNRSSSHLEYRPQHTVRILAEYIAGKIVPGSELQWVANQYYQNPDTGHWEKLNDYFLLTLFCHLRFTSHYQAYLRLNNALDVFYYSEFGVPMPGRELVAGIQVQL
jgi:outer membrane cobalamin receptor